MIECHKRCGPPGGRSHHHHCRWRRPEVGAGQSARPGDQPPGEEVRGDGPSSSTSPTTGWAWRNRVPGRRSSAATKAPRPRGATTEVFTILTQAPQVGRTLSVATGDGGAVLAEAARTTGAVFTARIPTAHHGTRTRSARETVADDGRCRGLRDPILRWSYSVHRSIL